MVPHILDLLKSIKKRGDLNKPIKMKQGMQKFLAYIIRSNQANIWPNKQFMLYLFKYLLKIIGLT